MTAAERADFERDGFLVIPNALSQDECAFARQSVLRTYELATERGDVDANGALHQLSAVTHCPPLAFLLDDP
jgi:ectoine hydroxylase